MAKYNERMRGIEMRKNGHSISSIAKMLRISKSTASAWCRDINLSALQIKNIAERSTHHATRALLENAETKRRKRLADIASATDDGRRRVGTLTDRDVYMVGLGLYWGEGYKRGSQEFGFTNSDPSMILFYIKWLQTTFGIKKENLILRVSINALHAHRVKDVEHYWSQLTKIPRSQFTKTSLIRTISKKVYANAEIHYGTLRIKVRRGTQLRREILGAITALIVK